VYRLHFAEIGEFIKFVEIGGYAKCIIGLGGMDASVHRLGKTGQNFYYIGRHPI